MFDDTRNALLNGVVVPVLLMLLTGIATILLAKLQQHLNVSNEALTSAKNSAAGAALTNAVTTFAGLVVADIKDGKLTMNDVKDGEVTAKLIDYLNTTVSDAMLHFNKPPSDLDTMMLGKMAGIDPTLFTKTN